MDSSFPLYHELPEEPPGFRCAWSYFNSLPDKKGKDQLGTLNFLTPQRKVDAAKETIQTGRSVSLELPLSHFATVAHAFGGRPKPTHSLHQVTPFVFEDSLQFNTQTSSQWDGFRHFGLRSTNQFYNGYSSTDFSDDGVLSTEAWLASGGIVGRGVLIDYHSWAADHNRGVDVNQRHAITLSDIEAVLAAQGTVVKPGDILIFRTGWLLWFQDSSEQDTFTELCERNKPGEHNFIGLNQEEAFVAWVWNNQVAAVAGDQVAFECTPPAAGGSNEWLHEHLLGALGCPIGELFDTESLAEECKKMGRYDFFFTSAPLRVPGGVASTCNALAIF